MIAYVHIGSEKSGSTTIQSFLYANKGAILKQGYFLPNSMGNNHRDLAFLGYSLDRIDSYVLTKALNSKHERLRHKKHILARLKDEIRGKKRIIFSSEFLQSRLYSKKELMKLRRILHKLGFTKIIIIYYIRDQYQMLKSLYSESIKWNEIDGFELAREGLCFRLGYKKNLSHFEHICDYRRSLQGWQESFGRQNLRVRLFDQEEFYQGNLLKDFAHSIDLKWDEGFIMIENQNESLNLLGMELLRRINISLPLFTNGRRDHSRTKLLHLVSKHFCFKDSSLEFRPPSKLLSSFLASFEEGNEWVRRQFFPHKKLLFAKKKLYEQNDELQSIELRHLDPIALFICDIIKQGQKSVEIQRLRQNIEHRDKNIEQKSVELNFYQEYGTAKARIQNQLSYKLGRTMIVHSKSLLGWLIMPISLLSVAWMHKQEQRPSLPPLQAYPDYVEALHIQKHLSYRLGKSLIEAHRNWYKGGYIRFLLRVYKLKKRGRNANI